MEMPVLGNTLLGEFESDGITRESLRCAAVDIARELVQQQYQGYQTLVRLGPGA